MAKSEEVCGLRAKAQGESGFDRWRHELSRALTRAYLAVAFALSRQAGMPEVGTDTRQEWDPLPITGQVRATGDPIADPYQTCSNASDTMRLEFCPAARAEGSGFERRFTTRELGRLVGRLGGEILRTDPLAACLEQTNLPQGMEGAACEARPRPSCGRAMPASTRKRTARCSENSRLDG